MEKSNSEPISVLRLPAEARLTVQTLGHIQYVTPWKHFPRVSEDYILYFVESGDLYMEEEGVRWHAGKNTALLLEAGRPHVGYQSAPVSYYYIHFTSSVPLTRTVLSPSLREEIVQLHMNSLNSAWSFQWRPSPYDRAPLYFPKLSHPGGSYDFFQTLGMMDRIFFEGLEGRRILTALRLQEMLLMLCREFSSSCVNPNNTRILILVRDIRLHLERNYASPITSRDISARFHMNYDYINRQFKRHTGKSIHDYLLEVRIHRSQRLLDAGCKVSDAAYQVGFQDAAYFSRLFKKYTHQSPAEYAHLRER